LGLEISFSRTILAFTYNPINAITAHFIPCAGVSLGQKILELFVSQCKNKPTGVCDSVVLLL
jgi:hypothetical protein